MLKKNKLIDNNCLHDGQDGVETRQVAEAEPTNRFWIVPAREPKFCATIA